MDWRPLYYSVAVLAIAAGFVAAFLDVRQERTAARAVAAPSQRNGAPAPRAEDDSPVEGGEPAPGPAIAIDRSAADAEDPRPAPDVAPQDDPPPPAEAIAPPPVSERSGEPAPDRSREAIERRVAEARRLWGAAVGKDGRSADIRRAYDILLEVQAQLEKADGDAGLDHLEREVSLLILDVSKSLPFDG